MTTIWLILLGGMAGAFLNSEGRVCSFDRDNSGIDWTCQGQETYLAVFV